MNHNRYNKDVSYFKFPVKNSERAKEWIKNSGNINIALMELDELKNRLICEKHFLPSDFFIYNQRKKLRKNAVPIRFVNKG